jgi:hypothetical protein
MYLPDGRLGAIVLTDTGAELRVGGATVQSYPFERGDADQLVVSPDGTRAALVRTGFELALVGPGPALGDLTGWAAWSPDGRFLAVCDRGATIVDIARGTRSTLVTGLCFSGLALPLIAWGDARTLWLGEVDAMHGTTRLLSVRLDDRGAPGDPVAVAETKESVQGLWVVDGDPVALIAPYRLVTCVADAATGAGTRCSPGGPDEEQWLEGWMGDELWIAHGAWTGDGPTRPREEPGRFVGALDGVPQYWADGRLERPPGPPLPLEGVEDVRCGGPRCVSANPAVDGMRIALLDGTDRWRDVLVVPWKPSPSSFAVGYDGRIVVTDGERRLRELLPDGTLRPVVDRPVNHFGQGTTTWWSVASSAGWDLYRLAHDGQEQHVLHSDDWIGSPVDSPDGRRVAWRTHEEGPKRLVRLEGDGR